MLTFSAKWTDPILEGRKDVTFRKWPTARVKVGGTYDAATVGYPPKRFARVEVTGLRRIKLGEIDEPLARRDGGYGRGGPGVLEEAGVRAGQRSCGWSSSA